MILSLVRVHLVEVWATSSCSGLLQMVSKPTTGCSPLVVWTASVQYCRQSLAALNVSTAPFIPSLANQFFADYFVSVIS